MEGTASSPEPEEAGPDSAGEGGADDAGTIDETASASFSDGGPLLAGGMPELVMTGGEAPPVAEPAADGTADEAPPAAVVWTVGAL